MANYNKSFNFRNGVQVDTDKFIVNTAGLVGIGSTIPTNYLDVNGGASVTGDINVTGVVTSLNSYTTGISTILGSVGIGTTNIDAAADTNNNTILNAGIVTALKYYGDGSTLSNVYAVAVDGWIVDSTVGSGIAYTTFSVGIGTTNPASGSKLHLHDSTACRLQLTTDNTGQGTDDGVRLMIDNSDNFEILQREDANIEFFTNDKQRVAIDSSGRFLLGLTD